MVEKIYLSPPHLGEGEWEMVRESFATNWIAPAGPHLEAFEREFCEAVGVPHAVAVSSGTAALHLALLLVDVRWGEEVLCSDLTFVASANAIRYVGARPVFIDCDRASWNIDPNLLDQALRERAEGNRLPRAVVVVHLYGQCADLDAIAEVCDRYQVSVIEDAAEALGATYGGKSAGTIGRMGTFSFNGNKIITTGGGGMLVSEDEESMREARHLSTQACDPAPHYQHSKLGFNYRMSNILAGIGRGQLECLEERVMTRRSNFDFYNSRMKDLPGVTFMPEMEYGRANRWLTCLTIDPEKAGVTSEELRLELARNEIEARPVWKPMHLQPLYSDAECVGGSVGESLFRNGLCLPSGSSLTEEQKERVVKVVESQF